MLDLTKVCADLYEIKMTDGEVIHIRRPSQANLIRWSDVASHMGEKEALDVLSKCMHEIINDNTEGKEYGRDVVEGLGVDIQMIILRDYLQFYFKELGEL